MFLKDLPFPVCCQEANALFWHRFPGRKGHPDRMCKGIWGLCITEGFLRSLKHSRVVCLLPDHQWMCNGTENREELLAMVRMGRFLWKG